MYLADPLEGRDDAGPIFPVGPVDPRLAAQTVVFGVVDPSGQTIAFPAVQARRALRRGRVRFAGVELELRAGSLTAKVVDGPRLRAHEAYWFAWSQFHPRTLLWRSSGLRRPGTVGLHDEGGAGKLVVVRVRVAVHTRPLQALSPKEPGR